MLVSWEETTTGDSGSIDEQGGAQSGRTFDVFVDSVYDRWNDVVDYLAANVAAGAAAIGWPHPTAPVTFCTRVRADRDREHPFLWHLAADYASPKPQPGDSPQDQQQQQQKPPDEKAPLITFQAQRTEYYAAVDRAATPRAKVNSAGQTFDNPTPSYLGLGVLRATRYYLTFDAKDALDTYVNCVNVDPVVTIFGTFPRDSLLVMPFQATPVTERGWKGIKVDWELLYKPLPPPALRPKWDPGVFTDFGFPQTGGWIPTPILDQGWVMLNAAGKLVAVKDDFGQALPQQRLLNGAGGVLAAGAAPKYLFFQDYDRVDVAPIFN
jgi:hypothetical protein